MKPSRVRIDAGTGALLGAAQAEALLDGEPVREQRDQPGQLGDSDDLAWAT